MTDFRSFLRDLGQTDDELKRLHEKLDQQWTDCLGMGGHGDSGGIGGGGTGGPRDGPLVSFSDTVELLIQAMTRQLKAEKRLEGFLETMKGNTGGPETGRLPGDHAADRIPLAQRCAAPGRHSVGGTIPCRETTQRCRGMRA